MSYQIISNILDKISQRKIKVEVCDLKQGKELSPVKVIKKTSSSDTAVAFSNLLTEENSVSIAMKIFLDTDTPLNRSLEYEARLYKYVSDNIISRNLSPHFVNYLGFGRCDLKEVEKLIGEREVNKLKDLQPIDMKAEKINILVTQKPGNGKYLVTSLENLNPKEDPEEYQKIFLQIIYSLYVMKIFSIVHNDFHPPNILVVDFADDKIPLKYELVDRTGKYYRFEIECRYMAYIFDWDRSYCPALGPNTLLEEWFCKEIGICNVYKERLDIYILFCYLNYYVYGLPNTLRKWISDTYSSSLAKKVEYTSPSSKKYPPEKIIKKLTQREIDYLEQIPIFIQPNIRELGYSQIRELLGEEFFKENPYYNNVTKMRVALIGNMLYINNGYGCRPVNWTTNFLSPYEILTYSDNAPIHTFDIFKEYRVEEFKNEINLYRAPLVRIVSEVRLDPYRKITRDKIIGKPSLETNPMHIYEDVILTIAKKDPINDYVTLKQVYKTKENTTRKATFYHYIYEKILLKVEPDVDKSDILKIALIVANALCNLEIYIADFPVEKQYEGIFSILCIISEKHLFYDTDLIEEYIKLTEKDKIVMEKITFPKEVIYGNFLTEFIKYKVPTLSDIVAIFYAFYTGYAYCKNTIDAVKALLKDPRDVFKYSQKYGDENEIYKVYLEQYERFL